MTIEMKAIKQHFVLVKFVLAIFKFCSPYFSPQLLGVEGLIKL